MLLKKYCVTLRIWDVDKNLEELLYLSLYTSKQALIEYLEKILPENTDVIDFLKEERISKSTLIKRNLGTAVACIISFLCFSFWLYDDGINFFFYIAIVLITVGYLYNVGVSDYKTLNDYLLVTSTFFNKRNIFIKYDRITKLQFDNRLILRKFGFMSANVHIDVLNLADERTIVNIKTKDKKKIKAALLSKYGE